MHSVANPPRGLRRNGRGSALWKQVNEHLSLDVQELALLQELGRTLDLLDQLDADIQRHALYLPDGRISPAVVERRLQQVTAARLTAALRLPADLSEPEHRPQRRSIRGVYDTLRAVNE